MKKLIILFIALIPFLSFAEPHRYIVKLNQEVSKNLKAKMSGKWELLTSYQKGYFKNLYTLETTQKLDLSIENQVQEILSIEEVINVEAQSIKPSESADLSLNDPFFNYQWGLEYSGQKVYNEKTDIENVLIPGKRDSDISALDLLGLDGKLKRNVVIAVIDTGVDYNHPDLKDNIYLNEVECDNGEIPYLPERSNDANEYFGDCKGWNFTGRKDEGDNRPDDFVGHGTHIAGIISAVKNNSLGVSGVSNKLKILPIKVLSNKTEDSQALGTSDRLTKAISYAIQMKADVINLSLGWPLSFDKDHLKNAVKAAIDAGVTVVAAAGNNDHAEPILPCGYAGVICVGSNDPDKKMSDFSNFGAHVDILAPGNNILSTYPTASTPVYFDVNGYEVKSGTSQAAPYISAVVGVLKGLFPSETESQIKERLYGGARKPFISEHKFASGNIVNLEGSIRFKDILIKPSLKGLGRVKVELNQNNKFSFEIPLLKYGHSNIPVDVLLKSSKDIKLNSNTTTVEVDQNKIIVDGIVTNLDGNLTQSFSLTLKYAGKKETYKFEKRFYVDFEDLKTVVSYDFVGGNPSTYPQLSTVTNNHFHHDYPSYYVASSREGNMVVSVFNFKNDKIINNGNIMLENTQSLLSIHRVDLNYDGKADYLIRSLQVEKVDGDEVQKIIFSYLDENLRPLFRKRVQTNGEMKVLDFSQMELNFEGVILQDLSDFAFGKMPFGEFGEIAVPVYLGYKNELPDADRNSNPFARLRRRVFSSRVYYYEPKIEGEKATLTTRTLMDNEFLDEFKKKISFRPFEQVFTMGFKTQSFDDLKNGSINILLSHESERKMSKTFILTLEDISKRKWSVQKQEGPSLVLSNFFMDKAYDLRSGKLLDHQKNLTFAGFEKTSGTLWEEFIINDSRLEYVSIEHDNALDPLEYPIKTYFTKSSTFRFFQTPSKLFAEEMREGEKKTYSFPTHVSSFLSGVLFREQHYPIAYIEDEKAVPALYVDATQISSRNIYMIKPGFETLVAPIRFNVNIPDKCRSLNPVVIGESTYSYSIQCFEDGGKSTLHTVPLQN